MPDYFKEYTADYKGNSEWYCQKEKCVSCKFSYGPLSFKQDSVINLRCKRPTVECKHEFLDKIVLKKIVGRKRVKSDNPLMVKYQYVVEEE